MTRLLIILFLGILLSLVGTWFYANPGHILVSWMGMRIEMSVWVALLSLALVLLTLYFVYRICRWVLSIPLRLKDRWQKSNTAKAEGTFIDMVSAYYAGEWNEALRIRKKLAKKLDDLPLFQWYSGLIFAKSGHHADGELAFVKLSQKKGGAFLSLKGQIDDCLERGDTVIARELLEKARELRDKSPWVLKTLYKNYVDTKHFEAAEKTVDVLEDLNLMTSADAKIQLANLQFKRSQLKTTPPVKREELLRQSHYLNPACIPVTLDFADLLMREGHKNYARSAVEATWKLNPNLALGEFYLTLFPGKTPVELYEAASKLALTTPECDESILFKAKAALAAHLWGEARALIKSIKKPTMASQVLLADLEIKEHNDLKKSLEAITKAISLSVS